MKTNIKLKIISLESGLLLPKDPDHYTVKLDSKKFPYIVYLNEKIIITRTDFPYKTNLIWGYYPVKIDIIEGLVDLKKYISNSNLTCDKLSLKQKVRMV